MREIPEIGHETSTLLAVGLGAVLATVGGFVATVFEARMHRRHRERTAALTFGEIMAGLRVLIRATDEAHGRGDPFGPVTMRLLRGCKRELDAYERSRPALADIRDTDLRLSVHALMLRLILAVDGTVEPSANNPERLGGYDYLLDLAPKLDGLVERLAVVAGQKIDPYRTLSHEPGGTIRTPQPPEPSPEPHPAPPPETAEPKARTRARRRST